LAKEEGVALLTLNLDKFIGNAHMWHNTFTAQMPELEVRI
jgi:hypothetical protein